jgi:hypothetical protein
MYQLVFRNSLEISNRINNIFAQLCYIVIYFINLGKLIDIFLQGHNKKIFFNNSVYKIFINIFWNNFLKPAIKRLWYLFIFSQNHYLKECEIKVCYSFQSKYPLQQIQNTFVKFFKFRSGWLMIFPVYPAGNDTQQFVSALCNIILNDIMLVFK